MADTIFHFFIMLICLLSANRLEVKIDPHLPDDVFIIRGGFMILKLPIAGI
jgi:hypothetical protein